ncbi:uncharacterized protein LOC143649771 [Tamandua tetradactyla]|uniref:uncharacterized protein LOC143649771 n=1 Tax=Tamandua tetradactyla TaxID=48850 RepID=UPI004053DA8F
MLKFRSDFLRPARPWLPLAIHNANSGDSAGVFFRAADTSFPIGRFSCQSVPKAPPPRHDIGCLGEPDPPPLPPRRGLQPPLPPRSFCARRGWPAGSFSAVWASRLALVGTGN